MNWKLISLCVFGWLFYGFVIGILAFFIDPEEKGSEYTMESALAMSILGIGTTLFLIMAISNIYRINIGKFLDIVIFKR